MLEIIQKIQSILDQVKNFSVGTSSRNNDACIIDYKGKRFIVKFKEIKNPQNDIFDDINYYL